MKITPEKLNNMYHDLGMSDPEIAKELGVSRRTITRWRGKLGVLSKRETLQNSLPGYLLLENPEPILGGNALEGVETTKQPKERKRSMVWSRPQGSDSLTAAQDTLIPSGKGEDIVRSAWRHADPSRNVLGAQI